MQKAGLSARPLGLEIRFGQSLTTEMSGASTAFMPTV